MSLKKLFSSVIFLALMFEDLGVVVCPKRPGEQGEASSSRDPQAGPQSLQFRVQPSQSAYQDPENLWDEYNRIKSVIDNDLCKCNFYKGTENCKDALKQFLRVPKTTRRPICRQPIHAQCYVPEGLDDTHERQCHFFVEAAPEETDLVAANWIPLAVCVNDLPDYRAPDYRTPARPFYRWL